MNLENKRKMKINNVYDKEELIKELEKLIDFDLYLLEHDNDVTRFLKYEVKGNHFYLIQNKETKSISIYEKKGSVYHINKKQNFACEKLVLSI